MNREILFRGKRIDNGEWVKGLPFSFHANNNTEGIETYDGERHKVDPATIAQFTGLTDKNGKKIFEGDILQFGEKRLVVWWNGEAFQWQAKERKVVICTYDGITNRGIFDNIDLGWIYAEVPILGKMTTRVIGNIHDNPELLEGDWDG